MDGCGRGCGWKMEGSETGEDWVWTGVCMEDEGERGLGVDGWVWSGVWTERGTDGGQRPCTKHVSGLVSNMLRFGVDDPGGKGGSCGRPEVVYEACFGVSLKHASFWDEIFRKLKLKPLQMEMTLGERGGRCWRTEAMYEACFGVSLKHASFWCEIFKKLRLKY